MGQLFGTDGIRGAANAFPLVPSFIALIGQAVAHMLGNAKPGGTIIVGTDTRESGDMIEAAITAGICAQGMDVVRTGILPTPGVAYLAAEMSRAVGGIVISASHNPHYDNGIKVFDKNGYKLSDEMETRIEKMIGEDIIPKDQSSQPIGRIKTMPEADTKYLSFLQEKFSEDCDARSVKMVIDCANGATSGIAPLLFDTLGIEVSALFIRPDGKNINDQCGSEHPMILSEKVVEVGADIGVAFDGDGDRLIAVDETGRALTGDQILAILAKDYKTQNRLNNNILVSTVMSNLGLGLALHALAIDHQTADVGDRRVMEKMRASGAVLGGEDSGHIILLDHHTTGDGLLSALKLLEVMVRSGRSLSELARIMTVAPQVLINVPVASKPDLATIEPIQKVIAKVETEMKDKGRVLVRYSGTQSLCRVMVEGTAEDVTNRYCNEIADVVAKTLG